MSAKDQIRAMIDQLMGTSKDGTSSKRSMKYDDPKVCKPFLLGCCPNDILQATRVDLGECHKIHDLALRADYEKAAEARKDLDYEFIALDVLEQFVADCDKKKEVLKRKLKETQEELSEDAAKRMNIINELGEQIGTKLAKAEEVGNTGAVDESMKILEEIEDLKNQKTELEFEFRNSMPASTYQQQKLRVCDVCSAYLGIHDNDRRLADHFGGKLHLGFIEIREKLEEMRERVKVLREKQAERRNSRQQETTTTSSSSYRSNNEAASGGGGGGSRRNDYDRRSSRERRDRDRHARRSRSRSTSKSRKSKHAKNRSRSRSRDKQHKSSSSYRKRSNSRDRKRHKRSRSRSPPKKHHRSSDSKSNKNNDKKISNRASTGSSDHSRSGSPNRVNTESEAKV